MNRYTAEDLKKALLTISSAIARCEKAKLKFAEGASHHTLLENRIKALYIAESLTADEDATGYSTEELTGALQPISSLIGKCEKGLQKFSEGTAHHTAFVNLLYAMHLSHSLITDEISKRE